MPRSRPLRRRRARIVRTVLSAVGPAVLAACSAPSMDSDDGPAAAWSSSDSECTLGPVAADGGIAGEAVNGEFWVLPPPKEMLQVGREFKLVFRLTGEGPVEAFTVAPDGRRVEPTAPLSPHVNSNFNRPGQEWGAFFRVDEPGCWELVVHRGRTSGVLPLPIAG